MIKVSNNAKEEFSKLLGMEGRGPQHFVRVGVKGGGCSGLSYDLVFDDKMQDGDKVFEDNGVKVVVDKKSLLYLLGTTLEFSGGLNGKGFQFVNPMPAAPVAVVKASAFSPSGRIHSPYSKKSAIICLRPATNSFRK